MLTLGGGVGMGELDTSRRLSSAWRACVSGTISLFPESDLSVQERLMVNFERSNRARSRTHLWTLQEPGLIPDVDGASVPRDAGLVF